MKKILLFTATGAALFAAGFWSGRTTSPSSGDPDNPSKTGPVASATAAAETAAGKAGAAKAGADQQVRTFASGRPFAKGQARAWLLELAKTMGKGKDNPIALLDAAQVLMTMDEASAMEVSEALKELYALWNAKDPTVRSTVGDDDLLEGGMILTMMRLSQLNPEAALALLKDNPSRLDRDAMQLVMARIATQDPARAEQLALTFPEDNRNRALEAIMHAMAAKDPAAALALAERHPDAISVRDQRRMLEQWARRDPQQAMPAAARLMDKTGEPEVLRQSLDEWYKMDPKAASAWVAGHEGPGKVTAQALLLEKRLAEEQPQALLPEFAALQKSATNQKELASLAYQLAGVFATKDVSAARAWAMTLPAGEAQTNAVSQVAQQWVRTDAPAASEWIKTLPPGGSRDAGAAHLARAIVRTDPASAFEWARSIQNVNLRNDVVSQSYHTWREQDPEAAKAAAATLPEDVRKVIQ